MAASRKSNPAPLPPLHKWPTEIKRDLIIFQWNNLKVIQTPNPPGSGLYKYELRHHGKKIEVFGDSAPLMRLARELDAKDMGRKANPAGCGCAKAKARTANPRKSTAKALSHRATWKGAKFAAALRGAGGGESYEGVAKMTEVGVLPTLPDLEAVAADLDTRIAKGAVNLKPLREQVGGRLHYARKYQAKPRAANPASWGSTKVQTILFDRTMFTPAKAKAWLKAHDYKASKVDETPNQLRFRQFEPSSFELKKFRTITLTNGIQAVVGVPRKTSVAAAKGRKHNPTKGRKANPGIGVIHLTKKGSKYAKLEYGGGPHWVPVAADKAKNLISADLAVLVPEDHAKKPHHDYSVEHGYGDKYEPYHTYYKDNPVKTKKISDKALGVMMHNWHSSQNDPIYGVGSLLVAGRTPEPSAIEEAFDRLDREYVNISRGLYALSHMGDYPDMRPPKKAAMVELRKGQRELKTILAQLQLRLGGRKANPTKTGRATKSEKAAAKVEKDLTAMVQAIGAEPNTTGEYAGWYPYRIHTIYGDLVLHPSGDSLFGRFEKPTPALGNPYTGKWNFHGVPTAEVRKSIENIMGRKANPYPTDRFFLSFHGKHWKSAKGDQWAQVDLPMSGLETKVGTRTLFGNRCEIYKGPDNRFYAVRIKETVAWKKEQSRAKTRKGLRRSNPAVTPSKRAWKIARYFQTKSGPNSPYTVAKDLHISVEKATFIVAEANMAYGPGGEGEEWFAKRIELHLTQKARRRAAGLDKPLRKGNPTKRLTDKQLGKQMEAWGPESRALAVTSKLLLAGKKIGAHDLELAIYDAKKLTAAHRDVDTATILAELEARRGPDAPSGRERAWAASSTSRMKPGGDLHTPGRKANPTRKTALVHRGWHVADEEGSHKRIAGAVTVELLSATNYGDHAVKAYRMGGAWFPVKGPGAPKAADKIASVNVWANSKGSTQGKCTVVAFPIRGSKNLSVKDAWVAVWGPRRTPDDVRGEVSRFGAKLTQYTRKAIKDAIDQGAKGLSIKAHLAPLVAMAKKGRKANPVSATKRAAAFFKPDGTPKYLHVYDQPESGDRYTIVFTGKYRHKTGGVFWYVSSSAYPTHPQGIYQHGESKTQIDYPSHGHLGKKISFSQLPEEVQKLVLRDYRDLNDLNKGSGRKANPAQIIPFPSNRARPPAAHVRKDRKSAPVKALRPSGSANDQRTTAEAKRAAPKPPKEKIQPVKIVLTRGEGLASECGIPHTIVAPDMWSKANELLSTWARTAPEGGGYDKTDFAVHFADGETYKGRYDLTRKDTITADLAGHIKYHVDFLSGKRPSGMDPEQYKRYLSSKTDTKAWVRFAKTYQIGCPACEVKKSRKSNPVSGRGTKYDYRVYFKNGTWRVGYGNANELPMIIGPLDSEGYEETAKNPFSESSDLLNATRAWLNENDIKRRVVVKLELRGGNHPILKV